MYIELVSQGCLILAQLFYPLVVLLVFIRSGEAAHIADDQDRRLAQSPRLFTNSPKIENQDTLFWGPRGDKRDVVMALQLREKLHIEDVAILARGISSSVSYVSRAAGDSLLARRCLPNLFLGGFPKTGTTALFNYLSNHSRIVVGVTKEPHFLTRKMTHNNGSSDALVQIYRDYMRGYNSACSRALSPSSSTNIIQYIIDGSQSLAWQLSLRDTSIHDLPLFLRSLTPHAKFVFSKRDPVFRSVSDYFHFHKAGDSDSVREFAEKVKVDITSMEQCFAKRPGCCCAYFPPATAVTSPRLYLSLYQCHLARWYAAFPRSSILEIDGFIKEAQIREVLNFLKVPIEPVWRKKVKKNVNKKKRQQNIDQSVLRALSEFFTKYNGERLLKAHKSGFRVVDLVNYCSVAPDDPVYTTSYNE
jgi:hypothetical protein